MDFPICSLAVLMNFPLKNHIHMYMIYIYILVLVLFPMIFPFKQSVFLYFPRILIHVPPLSYDLWHQGTNAFHLFGRGGRCEARGRALPLGVPRFEEMLVTSNVPSGKLA